MTVIRRCIVGVMGSHVKTWHDFSYPAGELIANRGYNLLTGAGGGVMTEVARGFCEVEHRKGVAIGILPAVDYRGQKLDTEEYPNPYIEIPMITPLSAKAQSDKMPFSRNLVNVMTAKALIIMPGSHGTRNEVSLALMYNKPLVLFGPEEEFLKFPEDPLRAQTIEQVEQFLNDVFDV
ncbi:MAG: hypothetical protein COA45_02540 [Zetaproteobacteria bacterium]|nr:MAG: hypothetical protein COA45_02540 [Zetaproteobacteria bacterium]